MFHFILIIIIIISIFFTFLIIKFIDCFKSLHCPICEFPCFTPSYFHRFCCNYYYYQINSLVVYTCTKARTCRWSNSCFYSIYSSLAQHQMSIVPFICFFISICIFFKNKRFSVHYFSEFLIFHSHCTQFRNIKCTLFIVRIRKSMRRIIKTSL
jgi:hypothetical protein